MLRPGGGPRPSVNRVAPRAPEPGSSGPATQPLLPGAAFVRHERGIPERLAVVSAGMASGTGTRVRPVARASEQASRWPATWEMSALRHHELVTGTMLAPTRTSVWVLVLDGVVILETSSGTECLHEGDAAFVADRTAHRLIAHGDADVAAADLRLGVPPYPVPSPLIVRDFASRHSGVTELVRRCPLRDDGPPAFASSYGGLIGASMMDAWLRDQDRPSLQSSEPQDSAVATALAALAAAPAEDWTVERLAGVVHLSRSALSKRFQRALGLSPMRVLREVRMQRARTLLADTSHTIEQVGHAVGYGSTAAFSRAFAEHHQASPRDWRRNSTSGHAGHAEEGEADAPRRGNRSSEDERRLDRIGVDDSASDDGADGDRRLEGSDLQRQR
jgi:AraC-like DNA-binding protein